MSIESTERPPKTPKIESEPITFTESDTMGINFPHHDPLVITVEIAHCEVARVFLDGGNSVNIIFLSVFRQLGVSENLLDEQCHAFMAFGGRHMPLTLSIGVHPRYATITTDFIVAECPSSYNVILGRLA